MRITHTAQGTFTIRFDSWLAGNKSPVLVRQDDLRCFQLTPRVRARRPGPAIAGVTLQDIDVWDGCCDGKVRLTPKEWIPEENE